MTLSENWATVWEAVAEALPDTEAIVFGEQRLRWADFADRAARVATALKERGVGRDAKTAQMLFNCPEYLEATFASFKVRAATVNVNYRYRAAEAAHVLENSDSEALFFHSSLGPVVDEARRLVSRDIYLIQVDDDGGPLLPGAVWYHDLVAAHEPAAPIARSGDDTMLLYTGGTTGMPRGVVWRHAARYGQHFEHWEDGGPPRTAAEVGRAAHRLYQAGRAPVDIAAPPLMHATGLLVSMATLMAGGRVILLTGRRFDPAELLGLVERERVTQLTIVGDAFARPIVAELQRAEATGGGYDIASVERIVSAGAAFSVQAKRELMLRAPRATVMDGLGSTEGGPVATSFSTPGEDPQNTATFTMTPAGAIFDPETWQRIAPGSGKAGVLGWTGNLPEGYYKDPEKTAAVFRVIDGTRYAIAGDYATVDADGTLHFLGRGAVCINTGGEKVYTDEVEVAIREHPAIADCVVVGLPDERFGEMVAAVASVRPGVTLTPDEVIGHVKRQIAAYKAPRVVVFVTEVRRHPSGKADYAWARRALVMDDSSAQPDTPTSVPSRRTG